jgi:hypothetical protein
MNENAKQQAVGFAAIMTPRTDEAKRFLVGPPSRFELKETAEPPRKLNLPTGEI